MEPLVIPDMYLPCLRREQAAQLLRGGIAQLGATQQQLLAYFRSHYQQVLLDTEPIDRTRAEQALAALLQRGLKLVPKFIWHDSPNGACDAEVDWDLWRCLRSGSFRGSSGLQLDAREHFLPPLTAERWSWMRRWRLADHLVRGELREEFSRVAEHRFWAEVIGIDYTNPDGAENVALADQVLHQAGWWFLEKRGKCHLSERPTQIDWQTPTDWDTGAEMPTQVKRATYRDGWTLSVPDALRNG